MLLGRQEKTDCASAYEILDRAAPEGVSMLFPTFGSLLERWSDENTHSNCNSGFCFSQYSSTPKQLVIFTGKAIELQPGFKDQVFDVEQKLLVID